VAALLRIDAFRRTWAIAVRIKVDSWANLGANSVASQNNHRHFIPSEIESTSPTNVSAFSERLLPSENHFTRQPSLSLPAFSAFKTAQTMISSSSFYAMMFRPSDHGSGSPFSDDLAHNPTRKLTTAKVISRSAFTACLSEFVPRSICYPPKIIHGLLEGLQRYKRMHSRRGRSRRVIRRPVKLIPDLDQRSGRSSPLVIRRMKRREPQVAAADRRRHPLVDLLA
jgi:hypothetical protein